MAETLLPLIDDDQQAAIEAGRVAVNILEAVNSLNDQSSRLSSSVEEFTAELAK